MEKNPRILHLFEKTKTVCVGRFLIEVPASAEVVYGPAQVPFSIDSYPGKGEQMETIIKERLAEIRDEPRYLQGALRLPSSLVGKTFAGQLPNQKIVFGVSKASGGIYQLESYLRVGDDLFVQTTSSLAEEYARAIQGLNEVASLLRVRREQEVPTDPGICIEDGFVRASSGLIRELISLGIRLAEFPDVHFSLSVNNKDAFVDSDALEPQLKQGEENARSMGQGAWYARIKTLRRGQRAIGKWRGFEVLAHMPAQAEAGETHEFAFLSQGEPGNPFLPVLDLEMHSGVKGNQIGGGKPSITDEEAVALWDKLTKSIRVRPTKEPVAEKIVVPDSPLGTRARSGTANPQSGWWMCADSGSNFHVEGGARQHFYRGVRMPQAVLVGTPSLWQRITSKRTRFTSEIPTMWTLVELDPPPSVPPAPTPPDSTAKQANNPDPTTKDS